VSHTKPTEAEQAQVQIPCGYCKAEPGAWCVTRSGWAKTLHTVRFWPWWQGWLVGYRNGLRDALTRVEIAQQRDNTYDQLITDLKRDLT
jgi:hypothetical protein